MRLTTRLRWIRVVVICAMTVCVIAQFVNPQGRAFACSCYIPTAEESLDSPVIFAGKVIRIDYATPEPMVTFTPEELTSPGRIVNAHLQVSRVWRGSIGQYVDVYTSIYACGTLLAPVGEEYLYYGNFYEGRLIASMCSATKLLEDAEEDLVLLGPGHLPEGVIDPQAERTQGLIFASTGLITLLLAGTAIAGIIAPRRSESQKGAK